MKTGTSGNWGRTVALSEQDFLTLNVIRATTGKPAFQCELRIQMRRCINCCAPVKEAHKRIQELPLARQIYGSMLEEPRQKKTNGKPPAGVPIIGERMRASRCLLHLTRVRVILRALTVISSVLGEMRLASRCSARTFTRSTNSRTPN